MMLQFRRAAFAAVIAAALTAPAVAADFTLNVNTALTVDDPLFKGLEAFRDNVAKSSNGKIEIKLFPARSWRRGCLGGARVAGAGRASWMGALAPTGRARHLVAYVAMISRTAQTRHSRCSRNGPVSAHCIVHRTLVHWFRPAPSAPNRSTKPADSRCRMRRGRAGVAGNRACARRDTNSLRGPRFSPH